jgi:hypothetical protein
VPASSYLTARAELDLNLIELVKASAQGSVSAGDTGAVEDSVEVDDSPQDVTAPTSSSVPASPAKVSLPVAPVASPQSVYTIPPASPTPSVPSAPVVASAQKEEPAAVEDDEVEDLEALIANADELLLDEEGSADEAGGVHGSGEQDAEVSGDEDEW